MEIQQIQDKLKQFSLSEDVLKRYNEHHRYYHNIDHILYVLNYLETHKLLDDDLFLTAVYHDAVYDPKSTDNEQKSADLFKAEASKAGLNDGLIKKVYQYIMDTKTHEPIDNKSRVFIEADLNIFNETDEILYDYERKIFKEFQFVDYSIYKQKRIEVLNHFNESGKLDKLIAHVQNVKPLIGLFAGSFNPFHKGHYNVLQKAERIFDKVIIAFGKNPEKNVRTWDVPKTIQNRQMIEYSGLLTDCVDSFNYEVIVVRGLRNSTDFQYEQNQYRYIQELKPNIKIVNVFCDKEFEHISSSGIRTLEKYNKHQSYLLD